MYAPVYRQCDAGRPDAGLVGLPATAGPGYADVLAAWRQYLARGQPRPRGGAARALPGQLRAPRPDRRADRAAAEPSASDWSAPCCWAATSRCARGKTTGGDFDKIPLCSRKGQAGCVVAFSTYGSDPQTNATFGNSADLAPGIEVACTDPTRLAGRAGRPFAAVQPSEAFAVGPLYVAIAVTYSGQRPRAATTWASPPDRYTGGCRRTNGVHVFRYQPTAGSRRLNEFPPTWGTHMVDINLGLSNLTRIVQLQSRTWLRRSAS